MCGTSKRPFQPNLGRGLLASARRGGGVDTRRASTPEENTRGWAACSSVTPYLARGPLAALHHLGSGRSLLQTLRRFKKRFLLHAGEPTQAEQTQDSRARAAKTQAQRTRASERRGTVGGRELRSNVTGALSSLLKSSLPMRGKRKTFNERASQ